MFNFDFVSYENQLEACRMTGGLVPHPAFQLLQSPSGLPMTTPWIVCAVGRKPEPQRTPNFQSVAMSEAPTIGPPRVSQVIDIQSPQRFIPDARETRRNLTFTETDAEELRRAEDKVRRQAEPRVEISDVWTEYGVEWDGRNGMMIHAHFTSANLQNRNLQAIAFYYHDDGTGQPVESPSDEFSTTDGALCVAESFHPPYQRAVYRDLQLFLPLHELGCPDCGTWRFKYQLLIRETEPYWKVLARSGWERFEYGSSRA